MPELLTIDDLLADDDSAESDSFTIDDIFAEEEAQGPSLSVPATPQQPADGIIRIMPRETEMAQPNPSRPDELLTNDFLPNEVEAGLVAAGETATRGFNRLRTQGLPERVKDAILPDPDPVITESLREQYPGSTLAGDIGANMAIPGGRGVLGGATSGVTAGLLTGPEGDVSDAGLGGVGGALGNILARTLGRGISPFSSEVPLSKRNKELARKLGIRDLLTTGEVTGSKALKNQEASIDSSSFIAGFAQKNAASRTAKLNNKILSTIGERGPVITAQILEAARKRISGMFQKVANSVKDAKIGRIFFNSRLDDILDEQALKMGGESFELLKANVSALKENLSKQGRLTGSMILAERRELTRSADQIRGSKTGDDVLADQLEEMADALDELIEFNAPSGARKTLGQARKQWAALSNLRDRNVVVNESVNPLALKNTLKRKRANDWTLGGQEDNPQFQLARLTEGLANPYGNPGTAQREGFTAGKAINDNTLGRAGAGIVFAESPAVRAYLGNQLVDPRMRELFGRAGTAAGKTIGPRFQSEVEN